jgi:phosphomannomutase
MVKKLVIFDLDDTLAESKGEIDAEMSLLLSQLLEIKQVAVISGGAYTQFQKQFLANLKIQPALQKKLHLFPTCGSCFYEYDGEWKQIYKQDLTEEEKQQIRDGFEKAFKDADFKIPEKLYGDLIEDRGSQLTFSAYGQVAPREMKKVWDPDQKKRKKIKAALDKYIPELETRIGGTTSIDVTRKGIDKAYGIAQMEKHLGFTKEEMLFIGDALFEGGNDYPVKQTGVECIAVEGPEYTKKVIRNIING